MHIFYTTDIEGDFCTFNETESKHCVKVLRMGKGDRVRLIDGQGNLYEGIIIRPHQKECSIRIMNVIHGFERRNYSLHIAISPLKNPERFEWFVEKSVEFGIDAITPLICRNTEKINIKKDRILNLIISAMKQSLKAKITHLNESCTFSNFISNEHKGKLMIAHCNKTLNRYCIDEIYKRGDDAVILIGPEGDFSYEEIGEATKKGFNPVHLGPSRLRTETAGIAACHSIYLINLQTDH